MPYFIHAREKLAVDHYMRVGFGLREICRKTGLARNTVANIFRQNGRPKDLTKVPKRPLVSPELQLQIDLALKNRTPGYCSCGCGQKTTVLEYDDPKNGLKAGESRHWMATHWCLFRRRFMGDNYMSQIDRQKERDAVRKEIGDYLYHNRFATRDEVYEKFANKGFHKFALGVILKSLVEDWTWGCNPDELPMPERAKKAVPRVEPYERKHIPYERETELPLLTASAKYVSLDADQFDSGKTNHERYSGYYHHPLSFVCDSDPRSALMSKEDWEEEEREAWPVIIRQPGEDSALPEGFGFVSGESPRKRLSA